MSKIAIVTDSNSGIPQELAEQMGISVLPMPFTIDGKEYFEGINLTQEEFYEYLKKDADIATSQPSPESVLTLWKNLLKEYDEVVHIPMSSGLSGSCQTAIALSLIHISFDRSGAGWVYGSGADLFCGPVSGNYRFLQSHRRPPVEQGTYAYRGGNASL